MADALEFGPLPDGLVAGEALTHPADFASYKGSTRLPPPRLEELARLLETDGFAVQRHAEQLTIDGDFEAFVVAPDGGWIAKPSRSSDPDRLYATIVRLCDAAGWALYDPAQGRILHARGYRLAAVADEDDLVARAVATLRTGTGDLEDAIGTLRRYPDDAPTTIVAIGQTLTLDRPPGARRAAVTLLRDLGETSVAALSHLLGALADPDVQTRGIAAQALGGLGRHAEAALPRLREMAEASEPITRTCATRAVESIEGAVAAARRRPPVAELTRTEAGARVEATIVFVGTARVVAKTANGRNVTVPRALEGAAKGDTIEVGIDAHGKPRDVAWTGADGQRRHVDLASSGSD